MLSRLLVPALALTLAAVSAQRPCTPMSQNGLGYYYPADRWTTIANATSSQECQLLCAANSDCAAYAFGEIDRALECIHQSEVTDGDFKRYFHSPPGGASGRCGTQLPLLNGDFPGNDLSNKPAPDAIQCSYQCDETRGCFAFSWTNYNGGTCWMKTARPEVPTAPLDGSVVSGEPFKCGVFDKGFDLVGGDLTSVRRANWRECCGVCRRTKGCDAATWTDYNGGTCWLKTSAWNDQVEGSPSTRSMRLN